MRDDHTTLARNPSYWGVDTYKGSPTVGTVIFRPVPNAGTRIADLENGTADMIFDVSPDSLDELRGRAADGFQVVTGNAAKLQFVEFMPKKASDPLADRRVRQALNHAVDVDSIVTNLFKGLGTRQSSPIMTGALGYDPNLPAYDYNPTFAKQLLADAGYPNGFTATMDLASSDNSVGGAGRHRPAPAGGRHRDAQNARAVDLQHQLDPGQVERSPLRPLGRPPGPGRVPELHHRLRQLPGRPVRVRSRRDRARQTGRHHARPGRPRRPYTRVAQILHDNPMGIYLANDVSIYGVGPRATGWRGPTGRDYLIPTNITLQ